MTANDRVAAGHVVRSNALLGCVYFGPLKLGRLLERHMRIGDAYGRLKRHHL